ncbi:MAG: cobalamin B12-binding domain-containing protein [Deltaproteobacteria bacterium]|nr:cobalamin B12-binding domain-containing protein [Deltaproteobacteria bacterium]
MSNSGFFISPPMGLVRLQHYLQERGIHCDILDLDLRSQPDYLQRAIDGAYDVIGISVSHYNVTQDLELLWTVREAARRAGRRCLFVGGGQEATMNYAQWLRMGIDVVLAGFAEKRLYDLCVRYAAASATTPLATVVDGMDGCGVVLSDGTIRFTPAAPLTEAEFHELSYAQLLKLRVPFSAYWEQVRGEIGTTNFHKNKFTVENARLFTSSHCPRGCGFCSSQTFLPASQSKKLPIIMLTAAQVMTLLEHYANTYGAKSFLFSDDDFLVGSRPGLERAFEISRHICTAKAAGALPVESHFSCQTRVVNFLHREDGVTRPHWAFIESLHEAGFHSVGLGVETFSDRLLRCPSVNKVGITVADCRMAVDALLARGLLPQINLILAVPESTVDEMVHSMRVGAEYIRQGCQVAVTALMKAIPGAPMLTSRDYAHTTLAWTNPETGRAVEIAHYFLPHDPQIAAIVNQIEPASEEELRRWKANSPWQGGTTPKFLVGLATFIAVCRLLNRHDDAAYFADVTSSVIAEVDRVAVI